MTAEFGVFFLAMALCAALFQALSMAGGVRYAAALPGAALVQFMCVCLAFLMLMVARLDCDFSVMNVAMHSNVTLPTLYKITGTWGNHEGSMLLWALVLSGFAAALGLGRTHDALTARTLQVQAMLAAGVIAFIIFTSNPFERVFPPPIDGEALNPLLQDVALAMHPPLLYLGYVGFSIVFSFAVAALIGGRIDGAWATRVHPWILGAWSFLTLGIGLGSWWAYRVLGWGGFWFWDPVENASLLPWLSGTALLHANMVLMRRGMLASWVALLSILTFGLSLLGTFLVRSGVLTSVHSFASDPTRGAFILAFCGITLGGALLLYALRSPRLAGGEKMLPLSREGMIVINNLFVLTACGTVLLGTLYPLVSEWVSEAKVTVGPTYFNRTFLPLMLTPLFGAGLAPFLPWREARLKTALRAAWPAFGIAGVVMAMVAALAAQKALLAALGLSMSAWLMVCSVQWLRRLGGAKAAWPVFFAHLGVAVLLAGLTGSALWVQERETTLMVGESTELAGFEVKLAERAKLDEDDYGGAAAMLEVTREGAHVATLEPQFRLYRIRRTAISVADIAGGLWYDLYGVIGETTEDGKKTVVRIYYRPLMGLFWAGFVLMALGGAMAVKRRWK